MSNFKGYYEYNKSLVAVTERYDGLLLIVDQFDDTDCVFDKLPKKDFKFLGESYEGKKVQRLAKKINKKNKLYYLRQQVKSLLVSSRGKNFNYSPVRLVSYLQASGKIRT